MYRSVNVDVDVYMGDFDDSDLVEELESRGYKVIDTAGDKSHSKDELLQMIYQKRRTGVDYQAELDLLISNELGRL